MRVSVLSEADPVTRRLRETEETGDQPFAAGEASNVDCAPEKLTRCVDLSSSEHRRPKENAASATESATKFQDDSDSVYGTDDLARGRGCSE